MQPTFDPYLHYVQGLAKLNSHLWLGLEPGFMPAPEVFNALAWGLVEEREEFAEVFNELRYDLDSITKEAGDVLAYCTLLLLCVASVEEVAEVLQWGTKCKFNLLQFSSNVKRVNREGSPFVWGYALAAWCEVENNCKEVHSLSFETISQTNLSKLQDRAARKVMFSGSGDNR